MIAFDFAILIFLEPALVAQGYQNEFRLSNFFLCQFVPEFVSIVPVDFLILTQAKSLILLGKVTLCVSCAGFLERMSPKTELAGEREGEPQAHGLDPSGVILFQKTRHN